VLPNKKRRCTNYFKRCFAQVDKHAQRSAPRRPGDVLVSFVGPKPNMLGIDERNTADPAGSVAARLLGLDRTRKRSHTRITPTTKIRFVCEIDICLSGGMGQ